MGKKIVITAGGTGGHLFPAQALAKELQKLYGDVEFLFVAKGLTLNPRFHKEYAYKDVQSATLSKCPHILLKGCYQVAKGSLQSYRILKEFQPDLIIGFGSYHTVPVLAAGWMLSIPIILHESNTVPGKVIRLFSKKAEWTGVFFDEAVSFLKGKTKLVDIPLRAEFQKSITRQEALSYFGLPEGKKTLLVFGGSQGALGMNTLFLESVKRMPRRDIQILHFTGGHMAAAQEVYKQLGIEACVKDFESNMHLAWKAADCCLTRSGAVTIAEQLAHSVPAFFIPYPHATDNHQEKNALYVERVVKGARMIREASLYPETLAKELSLFLNDDLQQEFKKNLLAYKEIQKNKSFCNEVLQYLFSSH
ncbi:MAG: murG [Chlamydiia bacterium]|nr:murG [Chlamydiia bacterium]